ncbi:hypothetical protein ACQEVZ_40430 [Dactylosporangium sp. CA-152071]|uniref:hypothetical protein n=1 Tax=Dactylosporangium sp. CA-152071 TaxID=3239933 RepID=UPI003D929B06
MSARAAVVASDLPPATDSRCLSAGSVAGTAAHRRSRTVSLAQPYPDAAFALARGSARILLEGAGVVPDVVSPPDTVIETAVAALR